MKRLLFLFLIIFTTTGCSKEIDGWGETTWGMTVEEVKSIYVKSSHYIDPENKSANSKGLMIKGLTFSDISVTSYLKFENDSLSSVRVVHTYKDKTPKNTRLSILTPEYKEFESSLTSSYGQPDFINELRTFGWYELGWYAGATLIKLTHRPDSVFIDYFQRKSK